MALTFQALSRRIPGSLAGNAILALVGQGFLSLTTFGTGVLVGRACGPEQYGLYFLGFTIVVFMLELQNALISTPYSVYAPRKPAGELPLYKGSILLHQAAICGLALLGFLLAAAVTGLGFGPAGMSAIFLSLSVAGTCVLLRDQTRRFCFTHLQMRTALWGDILVAVLQLGTLGTLYALGWLTPVSAFLISGLACAVAAGHYLFGEREQFSFSFARGVADFSLHWNFGRWVVASALVWGVSMNFYPWLVNYFRGAYEAGLWGASATLVALGNVFILGLHNLLGPRMAAVYAASGPEALRTFVLQSTLAFAVPLAMLSVFIYFAGPLLLSLIYDEAYAPGAPVMFVLSVNLAMLGVASVFSRGLFAIERADLDFQVNFLPLVLLFAAGIPLVKGYGIKGAAWALCLANIVALCSRAAAFLLAQPRQEPAAG